jgi:putative ABC transport system permease protein
MRRARWAARLLARLVPPDLREAFVDDLEEAVWQRRHEHGVWPARRWYSHQLVSSVAPVVTMWLRGSARAVTREREKSPMTVESLRQDLRYTVRWLWRSPGFTVAAAATIALGIGANTAIFSIVHALLLKPLPYPNPAALVTVWQDMRARGGPADEWATPANVADWRMERSIFASVASMRGWGPTLTGDGSPEPLRGEVVTNQYFETLGVQPALGRIFRPDEAGPTAPRIVILSDALWKRRFGGDRNVIGRRMTLSGESHEVVGVMPPGFRPSFLTMAEVWRPDRINLANPSRGAVVLRVVARLQPGVDVNAANAALARLATDLSRQYPDSNTNVGFNAIPLHEQVVGDIRPGLLTVFAAVLFVLLIACVNIANLLLARAAHRSREMAVRAALGADRIRVIRQLLTESVALSAVGSMAGVAVSIAAIKALVAWAPPGTPRLNEVGLDATVLAFAGGLTLLTGILFGLVPAFQLSRDRLALALKDGGRGLAGVSSHGLRRTLIASEIAVALVLLVGSGLFVRSFLELRRADLGFDPADVLVGTVTPPAAKYTTEEHRQTFIGEVLDRAAAVPGVSRAAVTSIIPLNGGDNDMNFEVEGKPPAPDRAPATWYRLVSANYFETIGMRLREGHAFTRGEPAPVVVINETMATRFWPGQSALGRHIRFDARPDAPWFTVVGVIADVKQTGARGATRNQTFIPYWQVPELAGGMNLVVKTSIPPDRLVQPLQQAIRLVDPDVPLARPSTMVSIIGESIAEPRFLAFIVGLFAILAMIVASVGVYGLMSYTVTERRTEIGVRLALGAGSGQIFGLVLGDGLRLAIIGLAVGLAGALALTPFVRSLLFIVPPADPLTFVTTALLLGGVTTVACMVPARRATRVDPIQTLRGE